MGKTSLLLGSFLSFSARAPHHRHSLGDDMTEIFMHFEVAEGVDKEQTAQLANRIKAPLTEMEVVEEVTAEPEGHQRFTGLEVAAAIGVAVVVVRSGRELVEELRKWIP